MSLTVVDDPHASRYALLRDGERIGIAEYVLDDVRANSGRRVIASCPYVRRWLGEHPEYRDLLTRVRPEQRS